MARHRRGHRHRRSTPNTPSSSTSPEFLAASSSPPRAAISLPVVLGRRRAGTCSSFCPTFSGSCATTSSPTHFLQHIHARDVGEGPRQWIPERPVPRLRQSRRRALWLSPASSSSCATPLSHARLDVSGPARALLCRQRPRLLHRRRLSHAARHGRRWRRALAFVPCPAGAAPSSITFFAVLSARRLRLPPSFFPWHRPARCAILLSSTTAICARNSAGTNWSAPSPRSATPCPPTSRRTSASPPATTASTAPSKSSGRAYGLP